MHRFSRSLVLVVLIFAGLTTARAAHLSDSSDPSNPYRADMQATIQAATENGRELERAYREVPKRMREGMAFLIAYMPAGDRDTLTADFLIRETQWAYKARDTFAWAAAVPDSVFYNDVLPYASVNEAREPWRAFFWEKFHPLIVGMTDVRAVVDTLNHNLERVLNVRYNTARRRPHQSPSESIELGMASCSGLSILFIDVLRTFGIPARMAGTPLWVSREGNHNWVELWIDGAWYFAEYHPTAGLNRSWFLERAGKADKSKPIHWMYATSWKPTGRHFPMVWAFRNTRVPGIDRSDFYIDLYNKQQAERRAGVPVHIRMFARPEGEADGKAQGRASADRVAVDVRVRDEQGKIVAVGTTAGPQADWNDYLTLYLPERATLTIEYRNAAGEVAVRTLVTGEATTGGAVDDEPMQVELFQR